MLLFQWYKCGKSQQNYDAIKNNPTALTSRLVLNNITVDDEGRYLCHVYGGKIDIQVKQCKVEVSRDAPC